MLRAEFDALLVDLDGTVYAGATAIPGAVDALRGGDQRVLYVTNNASRAPADVVAHLQELGVPASEDDVVTSAQAAAGLVAQQVEPGAAVLIVGTEALAEEVRLCGLRPVREAKEKPAAVVQGHSTDTAWPILAEACLAIRAGAIWVATNVDPTLPSDRGLLPGNGSMVAVLRSATGVEPQVAGKPAAPLMRDAIARAESKRPLVVGDRLDTDIEGGRNAGIPTLLVMTGVSTAEDLLRAPAAQRPDYLGADLGVLDLPVEDCVIGPVEGWSVRREGDELVITCSARDVAAWDGVRAACALAWEEPDWANVRAEGEHAQAALLVWGIEPR